MYIKNYFIKYHITPLIKKNLLFGLLFLGLCCQKTERKSELGTFKNPEEAYEYTTKTLSFISNICNTGIKSATYINEYEKAKLTIFKNIQHEEIIHP
jgi:hypothetical protein